MAELMSNTNSGKTGRPPLKESARKTQRFCVRLRVAEYRAVQRAAKRMGLSLSEYVRAALLGAS